MWVRLGVLTFVIILCACKPGEPVAERAAGEVTDPEVLQGTEQVESGPAPNAPNDKRAESPGSPAKPLLPPMVPLESPLIVAGDVVPPVRLSGGKIPWSQRDCRWAGPIIVETVIDTQGRVGGLRFLKEQPPECIQQPIRDTLKTWRFKPAELHGEPVSVYYTITVNIHWQ